MASEVLTVPKIPIVGAGPSSLTLASELDQHGIACRLTGSHLHRHHESRATNVQAPPHSPLIRKMTIRRIFVAGGLLATFTFIAFNIALHRGQTLPAARTIAINTLVGGEIAMLLGFRSLKYSLPEIGLFSNLWVWAGIGSAIALQLLLTYASFMNFLFQATPMVSAYGGFVLIGMVILYGLIELDKRRLQKH